MSRQLAILSVVASCVFLSVRVQAIETGDDLKLDPDKYLGKKVSLLGRIDADYQPLKVANGAGSFYVMDTGKNVRENYGNVTRTVFAREGQVVVFVPTAKISSFVTTFKQRLENNFNTAGKGFSGIYLKKDETEEFKEWRGWWYWHNYSFYGRISQYGRRRWRRIRNAIPTNLFWFSRWLWHCDY